MGAFATDTAVAAAEDGAFDCRLDPRWWIVAGPNGGYVAAILVRALEAAAGQERPLRSLTVHYLRPPAAGPARVFVETERQGRSVTFLRARMEQDRKPCALALAVLAGAHEGLELDDAQAPRVPGPEEIGHVEVPEQAPPLASNFDSRPAIGALPFSGAREALTGGWLRFAEPEPLDAAALVAMTDAWLPATFTTVDRPIAVPTLDLTVHLRTGERRPPGWVLARYRTRLAHEGYLEEDAELFAEDGELLAQSRQLALAR